MKKCNHFLILILAVAVLLLLLTRCVTPDDPGYLLADKRPVTSTVVVTVVVTVPPVVVTATPTPAPVPVLAAPVNQQQQKVGLFRQQVLGFLKNAGMFLLLVVLLVIDIPVTGFLLMVGWSLLKFFVTEW